MEKKTEQRCLHSLFTQWQLASRARRHGGPRSQLRRIFPPSFSIVACVHLLSCSLPYCCGLMQQWRVASRSFFFPPLSFRTLPKMHQCGHRAVIVTLSKMIGTFEQARSAHTMHPKEASMRAHSASARSRLDKDACFMLMQQ